MLRLLHNYPTSDSLVIGEILARLGLDRPRAELNYCYHAIKGTTSVMGADCDTHSIWPNRHKHAGTGN
jgi:hypothetical protein